MNNINYKIEVANSSDYNDVKAIWKESFDLSESYLNHLLDSLYPHATVYILKTNDKIVSSLFLFSISLLDKISKNIYHGYYLYGVCTLKKYRNNGYSTILIKEVINISKQEKKDFIITVPADIPLFNYYKKLDFNINVPRGTIRFQPSDIQNIECNQEKLNFIKNSFNKDNIRLYQMSDPMLEYMITSKEIYNKELYKGGKEFALVNRLNNNIPILNFQGFIAFEM